MLIGPCAGVLGSVVCLSWFLLASIQPLVAVKVALPDDAFKGKTKLCKKLFIDRHPFAHPDLPSGLDSSVHPRFGPDTSGNLLTLRAVYYEPRPAGIPKGNNNDLYTDAYANFHKRDLYIIKTILHANTVRLGPWDVDRDHSNFLDLCRQYGLFVIPTFDFSFFFTIEQRKLPFYERRQQVWQGFQKYIVSAKADSGNDDDLLLMWSINFGLNVNETASNGPRSSMAPPLILQEYFQLLRVIRQVQWIEDAQQRAVFPRPLAIQLALDSQNLLDEIGWYVGFSESAWGTWPEDATSLQVDIAMFDQLRSQGSFDAWILQTLPPTTEEAEYTVHESVKRVNASKQPSDSGMQWRNVSSQRTGNLNGDPFTDCEGGCTYPSQKFVVLQYGFAAIGDEASNPRVQLHAGVQQSSLQVLWKNITEDLDSCSAGGAVLDEWLDDWDRGNSDECRGGPYSHPATGPCDELRPGWTVRHQWYGLNGQYSFLGLHCLDPRYHRKHPAPLGCGDLSTSTIVGNCGFSFGEKLTAEDEMEAWKNLPVGFCIFNFTHHTFVWAVLSALLLGMSTCVIPCCFHFGKFWLQGDNRRNTDVVGEPGSAEQGVELGAPALLTTPLVTNPASLQVISGASFSARSNDSMSVAVTPAMVDLDIPFDKENAFTGAGLSTGSIGDRLRPNRTSYGRLSWAPLSSRPSVRGLVALVDADESGPTTPTHQSVLEMPEVSTEAPLQFSIQLVNDEDLQLTTDLLKVHLQEHALWQLNRLCRQVRAEAFALTERGEEWTSRAAEAMRNIHARVLEGYLAWLCSHGKKSTAQDLLAPRPCWLLFAEACLLRTMESLGEHIVHAPELMAQLFQEVRFRRDTCKTNLTFEDGIIPSASGSLESRKIVFVIEYKKLHAGIDAIRRCTNPFRGGVNFDDLNDYGEGQIHWNGAEDMHKTYQESTSWFVLLDVLANYGTVITVKIWVFFLAWFCFIWHNQQKSTFHNAIGQSLNALQVFVVIDAVMLFITELMLMLHGWGQRGFCKCTLHSRKWSLNFRFLVRRTIGVVYGLFSVSLLVMFKVGMHLCDLQNEYSFDLDADCPHLNISRVVEVCGAYIVLRVLVFGIVTRGKRKYPYMPGRPSVMVPQPSRSRRSSTTPAAQGDDPPPPQREASRRSTNGAARASAAASDYGRAAENDVVEESKMADWKKEFLREGMWVIVLLLSLAFETFLVVPLVYGIRMDKFCGNSCDNMLKIWDGFQVSSECTACVGSISLIYVLVVLTAMIDIHIIFYIFTGIAGYVMGEKRKLRNILSTALRHLDLNANVCHEVTKEQWESMSDGRAMERTFGGAWRLIWSRCVEALYEESLVSARLADTLVKAARTPRWRDIEGARQGQPTGNQSTPGTPRRPAHQGQPVGYKRTSFLKPDQPIKRIRFIATKLRGHEWKKAGRTKCISEILVRSGENWTLHKLKVDTVTAFELQVRNTEDRSQLSRRMVDNNLIVKKTFDESSATRKIAQGMQVVELRKTTDATQAESDPQENDPTRIRAAIKEATPPYNLVFVNPEEYMKAEGVLEEAEVIHQVSFITPNENESKLYPVCWKIEGSPDEFGDDEWLTLQTQAMEFDTPTKPSTWVHHWFSTEPWKDLDLDRGRGKKPEMSIDLKNIPADVGRTLCFFASSLKFLATNTKRKIGLGESILDSDTGGFPTLTQVIPVYEENCILTSEFLRKSDGTNTNLGFMISSAEDEWDNFASKQGMNPRELYEAFVSGRMQEWLTQASLEAQPNRKFKIIQDLILEVRLWASNRSQSVARTVAGAVQYHEMLSLLPCLNQDLEDRMPQETASEAATDVSSRTSTNRRELLGEMVELLIAHQKYGKDKGKEQAAEDADMRMLLRKYRKYPIYLVLDYDHSEARQEIKDAVKEYLQQRHSRFTSTLKYASLLCRYRTGGQQDTGDDTDSDSDTIRIREVEVVKILPRRYSLVLQAAKPRHPMIGTQGKAANQLGALRFATGHYLQMMDANMGAFFGEACKVPFVLRRFQPRGSDRREVTARIIGFRENIYTGRHGTVGSAMADAEWAFGTIVQRFLAGLGNRMHYGHPDFFDAFWAMNRGSVSKASPVINLSEDIFAGFNVAMRGEKSSHVDFLEWDKGREVSFNKASQFFTKVSSGSVGVMRSRDLKAITENLNITSSFSFYFASVGFYVYNWLIDVSMIVYVLVFVLLTLSSKSLNDIGELGSMLAVEWLASFGVFAMFPRLMELTLELGPLEGAIRFVPSIPSSVVMFAFLNKSIASAVSAAVRVGDIKYVATGRPNANEKYSWRESYFIHRTSHYYPAVRIIVAYMLYQSLAVDFQMASLPMIILFGTACCWLVAPIIFCPQPSLASTISDLAAFWEFAISISPRSQAAHEKKSGSLEDKLNADFKNPRANLYDLWLKDKLQHKWSKKRFWLLELVVSIVRLLVVTSVLHATMVDQMWVMLGLVSINFFLLSFWDFCGRPTVLMLLSLAFWVISVPMVALFVGIYENGKGQLSTLLISIILTFEVLKVAERIILLLAWFLLGGPNAVTLHEKVDAAKLKELRRLELYEQVVEYLYLHFISYQWHLGIAIMLLMVNLVTQLICVLLEMLGGLHSWWLLNGRLKGGFCKVRRKSYVPGREHEPHSERYRWLSGEIQVQTT